MRAGVTATIALVGVRIRQAVGDRFDLAAAVLALVILDPWLFWSIGIQPSVAATAGMVAPASRSAAAAAVAPAPVALAVGLRSPRSWRDAPATVRFRRGPRRHDHREPYGVPRVAPALLLGLVAARSGRYGGGRSACSPRRADPRCATSSGSRDRSGRGARRPRDSDGGPAALILGAAAVVVPRWRCIDDGVPRDR